MLQFGLVSPIFNIGYLMQNFRPSFISGHEGPRLGRPCCEEVRFFGADDGGLMDVRGMPELWATNSQRRRHQKLTEVLGFTYDATAISELVLSEPSFSDSLNISGELNWLS